MSEWKKKEIWRKNGKNFCVEVIRHSVDLYEHERTGPNRWCVYAYIYPEHWLFAEFSGNDMFQAASTILPLHGGPSLFRRHVDEHGAVTSVLVGADYNHLGDDEYTFCDDEEDARSVFNDADDLVEWLGKLSKPSGDDE
jgi:hypothetical protein